MQNQHSEHPIRIVVSDATIMGCELLADRLRRAHFDVAGCFAASPGLSKGIEELQPDVALISALLEDGSLKGFSVLGYMYSLHLPVKSVMILGYREQELVVSAFRGHARGVFIQTEPFSDLVKCIRVVHAGQIWASTEELDFLVEAFAAASPLRPSAVSPTRQCLTKREEEIVVLVSRGMSNREIAEKLFLSENTVKNYLFKIFDKLHVSNRVELALTTSKKQDVA